MVKINKEFLVDGPVKTNCLIELYNSADKADIGAHSIFTGQVRADVIDNLKVTAIEYSAYPEMVNLEMMNIINSVINKYNDLKEIFISHSTGLVKVGEISLLVFVASGHRKQAFRATEELVELIKAKVPVWKKEILENLEHRWPSNS
jgi:molybdopterin synthase catalytic subunit